MRRNVYVPKTAGKSKKTSGVNIFSALRQCGVYIVGACVKAAAAVVSFPRIAGKFLVSSIKAFKFAVCGYAKMLQRHAAEIREKGFGSAVRTHLSDVRTAVKRHGRLLNRCAAVTIPLALVIVAGITAPVWANFTVAKRVVYDDTELGEVGSEAAFNTAKSKFLSSVESEHAENYLPDYKLLTVYVPKAAVLSADSLAEKMLETAESIADGFGLFINGALAVACKTVEPIYDQLFTMLERDTESESEENEFLQTVEIHGGYYPTSRILNTDDVAGAFGGGDVPLSVRTVSTEYYNEEIPYTTEETANPQLLAGKKKVVTEGKNGSNRITVQITYVNGIETERVITGTEVIAEPVTEKVEVGTKRIINPDAVLPDSGAERDLLWPLPKDVKVTMTGEYHERRGSRVHRGVDLACKKGTPIYAAKSGTVAEAGRIGNYGICVVIDHGNGLKTRYAHCSEIYVKAGETVQAGEHIAAVGMTGDATGYHLHFEVLQDGVEQDPLSRLAR